MDQKSLFAPWGYYPPYDYYQNFPYYPPYWGNSSYQHFSYSYLAPEQLERPIPFDRFPLYQHGQDRGIQKDGEKLMIKESLSIQHQEKQNIGNKQEEDSRKIHEDSSTERQPSRKDRRNRNILSTCLKLYLRYIRQCKSESSNLIQRIIDRRKLNYTYEDFLKNINLHFNPKLNYVRSHKMKDICLRHYKSSIEKQKNFCLVLRISLDQFFRLNIHLLSIKSVRTNREGRWQQIKIGRKILHDYFSK